MVGVMRAPTVGSADRVLRLLESFTHHERDVSLGDLAERVSLPKSSVHRLLTTLVAHGFVDRDAVTRRYALGIRLFELGSAAIRERGLHGVAQPALESLARRPAKPATWRCCPGSRRCTPTRSTGPAA